MEGGLFRPAGGLTAFLPHVRPTRVMDRTPLLVGEDEGGGADLWSLALVTACPSRGRVRRLPPYRRRTGIGGSREARRCGRRWASRRKSATSLRGNSTLGLFARPPHGRRRRILGR